jgi:hypothetical protein
MSNDQEKWLQLMKEIKDVNQSFDSGVREKVFDSFFSKSTVYFLTIFVDDDGMIDDKEYELLRWLKNDLYQTEDEAEYVDRITEMMRPPKNN